MKCFSNKETSSEFNSARIAKYSSNLERLLATAKLVTPTMPEEGPQPPVVAPIGVKLPDFWPRSPATWFSQAEAQFALGQITLDATKYYHVVSKLDQGTAIKISDLLESPPETDKYQALKKRLTEAYSRTPLERAAALLSIESLGDRKPSELMDDMISLAGKDIKLDCPLFQAIFLRTLPTSVQQHLSTEKTFADPRETAKRADRLLTTQEQLSVHGVVKPRSVTREVSSGLCFYHSRWGGNAKKCKKPCTYAAKVHATDIKTVPNDGQMDPGQMNPDAGNGLAGRW